jgi:hypothetical protein
MNNFNLILFILIILLILTAILITCNAISNKIYNIKGGNIIEANTLYKQLNNNKNSTILLLKLKNGEIIIKQNNMNIEEDSIIRILTYGTKETLIGNTYILLNILNDLNHVQIDRPLGIILIGNFIIISQISEEYLNILMKYLQGAKVVDKFDGMRILSFNQKLQFSNILSLISELFKIIGKSYDSKLSRNELMYKLMSILMASQLSIKKGGGGETTQIVLNNDFISLFQNEIINTAAQDGQIYPIIQDGQTYPIQESIHTKFMRELVANNRNVEIISEKPHTENMKKGTIYFLPKKNTNIAIFAELGINNNSIPLGTYYINNSQNVIKIE